MPPEAFFRLIHARTTGSTLVCEIDAAGLERSAIKTSFSGEPLGPALGAPAAVVDGAAALWFPPLLPHPASSAEMPSTASARPLRRRRRKIVLNMFPPSGPGCRDPRSA